MSAAKIRFEKYTAQDFSDYFELVSNFDVMKMITEKSLTLDEAQTEFDLLLKNNQIHTDLGTFKVFDSQGSYLGMAKLELKNADDQEAELGYMLLPQYWGQGLGQRIAHDLICIAEEQIQLKSLVAIIDPQNIASRKILLKHKFYSKAFKDFDGLPGEVLQLDFVRHVL